jgi:hypothetical protein
MDPALIEVPLKHKVSCYWASEDRLCAHPETGRPYHQETIQQKHIRKPGQSAGLDTGAPVTVQRS